MITQPRTERWVWILFGCGVVARLATGLSRGPGSAGDTGYEFYTTIAQSFLDGNGLCYSVEGGCAERMPLYPLWLAPFVATATLYPGIVIGQSIVGGSLTVIAARLGTRLFDWRVGLLAAAAAAFSPYAVIHDTRLQETVFTNVLMPLSMLWLLRAQQRGSLAAWSVAGLALAVAVLVSARVALFVPCALAWALLAGGADWRARVRAAAIMVLPVVLLVGGWMIRNATVAGAPVLTTEAGHHLWFANNPATFRYFPERSIDLTIDALQEQLPPPTRLMLDNFPGTEAERDALVRGWAFDYMREDPWRTASGALRKLWVAAVAQLSPARGRLLQWGYAAAFLPVHLLAAWTLWRTRRDAARHSLTWLLLLAFAVTTSAFWAHTSHKSYLDAVLFIYAAAASRAWWPARTATVPA